VQAAEDVLAEFAGECLEPLRRDLSDALVEPFRVPVGGLRSNPVRQASLVELDVLVAQMRQDGTV